MFVFSLSNPETLIEYLETQLGLPSALSLLTDLGFNSSSKTIDLKSLTNLLEDEVDQALNTLDAASQPSSRVLRAGVACCQNEVFVTRSSLENVSFERDKLRMDLTEANQRALMLAQEIDDQNARLERASQMRVK